MPKQHDEKVAMLHLPPHGAVLTILTHEHIIQVFKASHHRDMRSWTGVSNFRGKEIRACAESTTVRTSILLPVLCAETFVRTAWFADQRRYGFVSCVVPVWMFSTSVSRCFLSFLRTLSWFSCCRIVVWCWSYVVPSGVTGTRFPRVRGHRRPEV